MTIRLLFVDEEIPAINWGDNAKIDETTLTPYMQYYLEAIQGDSDIDCTVVRQFNEAKEMLAKSSIPFDVVSLDVMMPVDIEGGSILGVRAGLELLKTIIEVGHAVPVILFSNVHPILLQPSIPNNLGAIRELRVLEKESTDPFMFVEQVKEMGRRR